MAKTDYAKTKDLESKFPHEKADEGKDYEQRLSVLEAKEKKMALQKSLTSKKLDNSVADYLKDDVGIEKFGTVIDNLVSTRLA